jgi:ornithine decarboxylase
VDLDLVARKYRQMRSVLPKAKVYYAVKANPAPEVLRVLAAGGASFDCASIQEIDRVLGLGIDAARISYGNTIKKPADIAADWPLSRKFGCDRDMAVELLLRAHHNGMDAAGVSFHVGSQQRDPGQWDAAIAAAAEVFRLTDQAGLQLTLLNIGGGMPADLADPTPSIDVHVTAVTESLDRRLPLLRDLIVEPGRSIVADAGTIVSEVVLVSRKSATDAKRWVYLDVGKFNGLPETADEAIRYRITTAKDHHQLAPVILAGPTCDSLDILYEKTEHRMPVDLQTGDRVRIHGTGAYTASYAAVGLNGFPPLRCCYLNGAETTVGPDRHGQRSSAAPEYVPAAGRGNPPRDQCEQGRSRT